MDLIKRITTYFSILVFTLTGLPVNSIASEGDEEAGAFEDPNAEEASSAGAAGEGAAGAAGAGAGAAGAAAL